MWVAPSVIVFSRPLCDFIHSSTGSSSSSRGGPTKSASLRARCAVIFGYYHSIYFISAARRRCMYEAVARYLAPVCRGGGPTARDVDVGRSARGRLARQRQPRCARSIVCQKLNFTNTAGCVLTLYRTGDSHFRTARDENHCKPVRVITLGYFLFP